MGSEKVDLVQADASTTEAPEKVTHESCNCERCWEERHKDDKSLWRFCRPFIACAICGNKRCPHATDHRNACTGSNEPGQAGEANALRRENVRLQSDLNTALERVKVLEDATVWVGQVYPATNRIEMTWDEWNRLRIACGHSPQPSPRSRTRVLRVKEARAVLQSEGK